MEALAAGVPVVARDLPVLREVFGDTVRYADTVAGIADALAAALSEPSAAARAAGVALAATYTWDAAAARHERFYAAVLRAETAREGGGAVDAPVDLAHSH